MRVSYHESVFPFETVSFHWWKHFLFGFITVFRILWRWDVASFDFFICDVVEDEVSKMRASKDIKLFKSQIRLTASQMNLLNAPFLSQSVSSLNYEFNNESIFGLVRSIYEIKFLIGISPAPAVPSTHCCAPPTSFWLLQRKAHKSDKDSIIACCYWTSLSFHCRGESDKSPNAINAILYLFFFPSPTQKKISQM
jgi:hypothetical protein